MSERNKIRSMTIKKVREDILKSAEQRYLVSIEYLIREIMFFSWGYH